MREYAVAYEDGTEVDVADLPMFDLVELLLMPVLPSLDGTPQAALRARLNLELFIRERNLRDE